MNGSGGEGMKKESLKRQAMITACCGALVRAMGFGLRLWISRLLGAEALGVTELASGAHMLALTPAAAGLPSAVSRLTAKAENTEQRQIALYAGRQMAAWLGLWVTPLFLLLSPLLARLLGDERTLPALVFFAPCVLTVGMSSVYDGYFFGQGKALPPALSEGAEQIVRLCVVGALAFLVPRAGKIPGYRRDARLPGVRKQLLSLSLPLLLNRLCHTALRSLCGVVIPLRLMADGLDRAEAMSRLGMFSGMAMPLMFLPCLISGALAAVGGPAMARCKTKQAENRLAFRLLSVAVGTGLLAAVGLYVLSPYIANLFYRLPELTPVLRAAAPLAVLLPAQQTVNGLMTGLGLQKRSLFAGLLGAAATLLCTWQWTPTRGIYGAAFASMAGHGLTLFCELAGLLLRTRTT